MAASTAKRSSALVRYGGFVASVGTARVLGLAITSVTFPILVRRLGVQTYGLWSYIVALCAFLEVIANPGLTSYVTQQVAAHRHAAADLIPDFLALRGLSALAALLALLGVVSIESHPETRRLLCAYGIASLLVGLAGSDFLLTSLEMFHLRSLLSLIQQSLYAAGVLLLVRGPNDLIWLPASILGSAFITNLAGWVMIWKKGFHPPFRITPSRWRSILVPSLHYAATTGMATVYHRTGHLVVRWLLGEYALGLYAAAIRFVDVLRNFVGIALNVVMPRMALAAKSIPDMRRLLRASVSAVAAIGIPLMLGTVATAHLVVPWVLGKGYEGAVQPVRLVAALLLAGPMASLLSGTVLYAMGKHREYLASASVGALTAISLSYFLGRTFGLPGVCIAFVLAEAAVAFTAYLLIPSDLRDLWKNPIIPVAAGAALLMVASVRFANVYSSSPLVVVLVGGVVYLCVSGVFGIRIFRQQFGVAH
jgi:O-antigen/teichoic acid export membrane protein